MGGSLDALAVAVDPFGSLFAWGVGWLIEHVKPLKDALDWLAGKPDEIAAHAATWRNVSAAATDTHHRYAAAFRAQTADWHGASGDAYRTPATEQLAAVDGIATVTNAISAAVEGAGLLVALVREIVRDLIAQFVATPRRTAAAVAGRGRCHAGPRHPGGGRSGRHAGLAVGQPDPTLHPGIAEQPAPPQRQAG